MSQTAGELAHKNIENRNYSSLKKYKQNMAVYSDKYRLCDKVDIYDIEEYVLIEYKNKINEIYDGQKYQLYGQYFCLSEMGYQVNKIFLYSKLDNKKYILDIPNQDEKIKFENLIHRINTFDIFKDNTNININKCIKCIYNNLCDKYVDIT